MTTGMLEGTATAPAGARQRYRAPGIEDHDGRRGGRALGWLSAGLGVAPLAAPELVRRMSGVDDSALARTVVPLVGARELVHAAGLLAGRRAGRWAWTRVAGDAIDLAALGVALRGRRGERRRRVLAVTAAVAGITALDVAVALRVRRRRRGRHAVTKGPISLTATTTIGKPPREVYDFWRPLDRLPEFMAHLDEVRVTGDRTSRWRATAPFGRTVRWDAEITEDVPGTRLSWRSTGKTAVPNAGTVSFRSAPDEASTEVHVRLTYDVRGGAIGKAVARYFGEEPHQQLDDDLRRLKQVMETGEVVRSDGAPWGERARREFPQRPARPMSGKERRKVLSS